MAEALRPLLDDVRTLARFGIEISRDSGNLIAVPLGHVWHTGSKAPVEIRLYLFDLADKNKATALPIVSQTCQAAEATLSIYLNEVLFLTCVTGSVDLKFTLLLSPSLSVFKPTPRRC